MTRSARISLGLAFAAALAGLNAPPARAALVTWTFSGTAGASGGTLDYFANGSPYAVSITYDSSAAGVMGCCGNFLFDSALVSVSFTSPTYSPTISLAPPDANRIAASSAFLQISAGSPFPTGTSANPGFQFVLGDVGFDPSHLPIAPPSGVTGGGSLTLLVDNSPTSYIQIVATVPISSIHYSVPEPATAALAGLIVSVLALRLSRLRR
jgi:hypothetical protein